MSAMWTVLHAGALGDLVLTIQLALRLPGVAEGETLRVLSRTNPGDLSLCRPSIVRRSTEGLGLHWLYGDHDDPPPEPLREALRGTRVLSALGGTHTITHHRLATLGAAAVFSFDPQPHPGLQRHITQQWQTQLESQGLLVPKCVHQRPTQRALGVPQQLRQRGRARLQRAAHARDCIVIHPGSGGRAKCWPLPCFIDVARRLQANAGRTVCWLMGPVEAERWTAEQRAKLEREFPLLLDPSPNELVEALLGARVCLGNDSGPSHLAALLGTPIITIFGPTSAAIWQPLALHATALQGDPPASAGDWGVAPHCVAAEALRIWQATHSAVRG